MKGLIILFLAIVFSIIGWSYCSAESKAGAINLVKKNLFAFILATMAVAVAIAVSTNSSLRLV